MKFSHFFIDRPIFATVLSILLLIVGGLAYVTLPVAQYPDVVPPTIEVSATYPGAHAETVANTVATPLEQEINGVEDMFCMLSQSTGDGRMTLTITFKLGTDLDEAQVLVQNRVAIAEPRLPEEVRRLGVTTRKNSLNLMMVVNLYSPDRTYDQIYIANYATLQLRDALARINGVGDIEIFGASEYAMRIWLDPDRIAYLGLTAGDVVAALRAQNVQVASGILNQPPMPQQHAFEFSVQTQGRLVDPREFENIVVKSADNGRVVRLKNVGRAELGAQNYVTSGYLGDKPTIALPIYQRPGTNVLETADEIIALMEARSLDFPEGLDYEIVYNPTAFVRESVDEVLRTMFEAVILVTLVIIMFLQSWRAAIIPVLAIPVSLVATFAVMQAMGFSLNSLSLFGLALAIGIVVDDAIVVVENMERLLATGMTSRDAARQTMDEVGGALVAMGLVLVAVFLPTTFLTGISDQFYRQFGIAIAVATMVSVLVSLTLSPAMAELDEAFIVVIPPPPVEGIDRSGGFRMMIQDRRGHRLDALKHATYATMRTASQAPEVASVFTLFETSTPKLYLDIDRQRAEWLGVPVARLFETLEVYLGSVFVNDFNYLGRTFRVTAQADSPYRFTADDIVRLRVRNHAGEMVSIGSIATLNDTSGPSRVPRYNLFPAAALIGDVASGYNSGEALKTMERLAEATLPSGFSYEWTEIALQQKQTGNTATIAFVLAVVFVFLLLAAQYESWTLPWRWC